MAKIFFQYNPETLTYERVYVSIAQRIWIVFRQLIIGIGMGAILFAIATYAFDSPHERRLKTENKLLLTQYEVLNKRISENEKILSDLQQRDDDIYRAYFNADPIHATIRRPGFGGTNRYEALMNMPNSELIISTTRNLDIMTKELVIQNNSYDELAQLLKTKDERFECQPIFLPIDIKDKKRLSSGFGIRLHPITKVWQPHTGIDITADAGAPIYATGKGVVELAEFYGGYGYCVIIDHGFGYKSLYGHCRELLVKKGQKVTRKQKIATVGNTGQSVGNHLHYEVIVKGVHDNPAKYFWGELDQNDYLEFLELSEIR